MILFYLLVAALVGPLVLGAVAVQQPRDLHQMVLMAIAILLPVVLAAALWFFERLAEHGGDLFGSTSDGDIGIWLAWQTSFLLLPVSFGLAFLGRRIGRPRR